MAPLGWRESFLWAPCCHGALAIYPRVQRNEPSLPSYLILLPAEFACFHSGRYPEGFPFPALGSNSPDILSVALFLPLLTGAINPCGALWSPDFPHPPSLFQATASAILRPTQGHV